VFDHERGVVGPRVLVVLASTIAISLAVHLDAPTFLRAPLAFWFVCVCPGLAWVGFLGPVDRCVHWLAAAAGSLGLIALVTALMAFFAHWSVAGLLAGLAFFVVLGVVAEAVVTARSRRRATASGPTS
jgi:uncharacterized membrane protein